MRSDAPCDKNGILLLNVRRALPFDAADGGFDFLGLFYLAAVLEKRGYEPWVYHGNAHELPELLEREVAKRKIAAVGFSCDYENFTLVEELCAFVKRQYGLPVVVGGPQAIALKETFFGKSGCDAVVRGEGEETLPELLDCLLRGEGSLERIAGVTWLDAGGVRANPDRARIRDLDRLPLPAFHRSLLPARNYGRAVFTGRGCPFSCAFCYQSTGKRQVRLRDLDRVLDEIRLNLDRNPEVRYVTVLDDTFTLDPARVQTFCKGVARLREERDFVWYCEGHVNNLAAHPEMMEIMAASGLARLQIGVESGSQRVLDGYGKKTSTRQIEAVVAAAVRSGIPQVATNLIVGGAFEDEAAVSETLAFADRLLHSAPGVIDILTGFLRPYPGTAITGEPEAFALRLVDHESVTACDDYPVLLPAGTSHDRVIQDRLRLASHILSTMKDLVASGAVPHERVLGHYRLCHDYGVTSLWLTHVYRADPLLNEYYRLLSIGEGTRLAEVPAEEAPMWRPLRTVELRRCIGLEEGFPRLGQEVLSPLEFELLLRCSAKLRFGEVLAELHGLFGDRFADRDEFVSLVVETLHHFDRNRWVVFTRL